jgi:hypothetical protein
MLEYFVILPIGWMIYWYLGDDEFLGESIIPGRRYPNDIKYLKDKKV